LKIDRLLKGLSDRINAAAIAEAKLNLENSASKENDDYYLATGSEPPRFLYYRHVRWQKLDDWGRLTCEDVDKSITQDELDYALKRELRVSPEQRYQEEKHNWFFHELTYLHQAKEGDIIKEYGCGHWSNNNEEGLCVIECRYYHKEGRIEDEEIKQEHKEYQERLRRENRIVEPPDMNSTEAYSFFKERNWSPV
jgi:hypothetical protein